ncbi:MAG TPA: hypothetical protein VLH56_08420, partial [Dissulfurispiraceae bacterium]|nr:hypothetical protein [Dissulfurispiraceae bacterium]
RKEMLIVETICKIRYTCQRDGKPIRQIVCEFHLSRNTVKKVLRGDVTEFACERMARSPFLKLRPYEDALLERLKADVTASVRERRTAIHPQASKPWVFWPFLIKASALHAH